MHFFVFHFWPNSPEEIKYFVACSKKNKKCLVSLLFEIFEEPPITTKNHVLLKIINPFFGSPPIIDMFVPA